MDCKTPSSSLFLASTTKVALARGFVVSGIWQPVTKTLSCFSLILRIDGGAPAGIRILPGDAGCRKKRKHIKTITIHGKRRTSPRGIEIEESPFKRILRRKKATGSLGANRSAFSDQPFRVGRGGGDDIRLVRFCTKPMRAGYACRPPQDVARFPGRHDRLCGERWPPSKVGCTGEED